MPEVPDSPARNGLVRHPALVALSRDHHAALVQALELRRATPARATQIGRAFLRFYETVLRDHFGDEEEVLLPAAALVSGVPRVLEEHRALHAHTASLRDVLAREADPLPLLQRLGAALHDHVRFEERAFFMDVQSQLDPEALRDLGQALDARRRQRGRAASCAL